MLSKANIPPQDPRISQFLNKVLDEAKTTADQRAAIDKKLDKTKRKIQEKVENAFTVSEYFKQLWEHPELKTDDKNLVIVNLETLQKEKKKMIGDNTLQVSKKSTNVDDILETFKMKPYEEHGLQEKIKEMKRKNKLSTDQQLQLDQIMDKEIIQALHRPFRSMQFAKPPEALHYIAGTEDPTETEVEKKTKAVEFVKKINDDKAVFEKKMKRIEERVEERENGERERFIQKEQEMEEQRRIQRKKDVEQNLIKLKARSEARLAEDAKWKDEYKSFKTKKPLYQEKEDNFNKQFVLPELEEKKKKLQNLRNFYKPMDMQEIFQHEKKFLKDLEEKAIQKREASEEEKWIYKKPAYESKYQRVFAEELVKARSQKEDDQAHRTKIKLRVDNFLKDYKEKYSPRIDLKKSSASGPATERNRFDEQGKKNKPRATKDYKKLGDDYMLLAKNLIKKKDIKEELLDLENELKNDPTEFNRLANRTIGSPNNVENQEQSPKRSTHNYLTELRKMNKLGNSKSQVQLIIKNKDIDKLTRHELLQSEVEKMEEKVRQREQILKIRNRKRSPGDAAGDYDEVDDMYISSIKAKLGMLNSARS